jgi:uncharacterized protein YjeT (DUF2065 family)
MGWFLTRLFRSALAAAWKTTWLLLVVLPGYALMLLHVVASRLAGRQERLLPTSVYRLAGFGLTVVGTIALFAIASLISRLVPPSR